MNALRKGLPTLPARIRKLPVDARGYPTPWFVETLDDGSRDFRIASEQKRIRAAKYRLCWICGEPCGHLLSFVIGPMCAVNRNTSEPGCHRDCAEFAVQACPFMILPKAQYRRAGLPGEVKGHYGALPGNPGATCIWITRTFKPYKSPDGGWLMNLGDPVEVLWYCEGKPATRAQILASFDDRLPALQKMADEEGPEATKQLALMVQMAMKLLPA